MTRSMKIAEAREKFTRLSKEFKRHPELGAIEITTNGQPVLAILSWELYEGLLETLEIMSNPALVQSFRKSVKELEHGKTVPWNQVKARLNL